MPLALPPHVLEPPPEDQHHAAVWAHLNANKIGITNKLLRLAGRLRPRDVYADHVNPAALRRYAYHDFYRALRSMAAEGYAGAPVSGALNVSGAPLLASRLFYLGDTVRPDAGALGLVNMVVFLSQALADSVA